MCHLFLLNYTTLSTLSNTLVLKLKSTDPCERPSTAEGSIFLQFTAVTPAPRWSFHFFISLVLFLKGLKSRIISVLKRWEQSRTCILWATKPHCFQTLYTLSPSPGRIISINRSTWKAINYGPKGNLRCYTAVRGSLAAHF